MGPGRKKIPSAKWRKKHPKVRWQGGVHGQIRVQKTNPMEKSGRYMTVFADGITVQETKGYLRLVTEAVLNTRVKSLTRVFCENNGRKPPKGAKKRFSASSKKLKAKKVSPKKRGRFENPVGSRQPRP